MYIQDIDIIHSNTAILDLVSVKPAQTAKVSPSFV
jgi:hypothetical protein